MRRTEVVLSLCAAASCTPSRATVDAPAPAPPPTEAPAPTCADDAEALHRTLLRIEAATGPRIAPGPLAPWPAALDPDLDFAFFLRHEGGQWWTPPFDPSATAAQIQTAYAEAQERHPGSEGFLLAADAATPTREVAARLVALERAGITVGSFNVEVPLADPLVPPDPLWLEEVGPRLSANGDRVEQLVELSLEQLDRWEPQCGDLSWTFELDGVAPEDRGTALAQRFADGHRSCACRTSAERWSALFYVLIFGVQPTTTTDGDYPVHLSENGTVIAFAPDEDWGTTIQRLRAPSGTHTNLWLVETSPAP